jgi:NhaA family Na+:H+ antiporter
MNQGRRADTALDRLPGEVVDWLTKPLASFLRIEAGAGAILLAVTIAALILSNSPWAHQFPRFWELPVGIRIGSLETARSLRDWINDALMTLFFFVVALELKLSPVERLEIMLLTVGKPLGVITFSWLAVRSGIAIRPPNLDWGMLAGGGMLAGIGFTMALFIAELAVQRRPHRRRQAGHLVCIGRFRGAGYCAAGLVVFQ